MRNNIFITQLRAEAGHFLSNTTLFLVFVMAPIFYGLFYAVPYTDEIPRKVPLVVVDQDKTKLSRQFTQMLDAAENTSVPYSASSFEEAKNIFYKRQAYGMLIIPNGFQRKILRNEMSDVALFTDGSYLLYYKQSFGGVQAVAGTLGAGVSIQRLQALGVPSHAALEQRTSATLNIYALYNPSGGYATYVLPAVFILICHQIMIAGISISTADEHRTIIFGGKYAPPVTRLGVKTLFYFSIAVLQCLFLFGVALPMFNIPFNGRTLDLILLFFPFYLAVIFMGIILGSLVRFSGASIIYVATTSIPLLFLSGLPWSKLAMPDFVRVLRVLLPSTHGIDAFVKIFREGAPLSDVAVPVFCLWAIAALLCPIALYRLARMGHRM